MNHTRPGGWIEVIEDDFVSGGPALELLADWAVDLCKRRGIDFLLARKIGTFLEEAGLSEVTFRAMEIPIGPHGERLGLMAQTDYLAAMGALKSIMSALDITTEQAYAGAVYAAQDEIERGRCIWPLYIAFGQKIRSSDEPAITRIGVPARAMPPGRPPRPPAYPEST